MSKGNFIKTSDEETARKLRDLGFYELAKEGDKWVFANMPTNVDFSADKNVVYTNVLTFD